MTEAAAVPGGGAPQEPPHRSDPKRAGGRGEPKRTVVFGPGLGPRPRRAIRPLVTEIAEQTEVGDVVLRSLLSAQLRLALLVLLLFGSVLGGLPLLFVVSPHLSHIKMFGVPVQWLLVAVGVFPLLWAIARLYVHFAERNEAEFVEIADRP
ncbi:MAG TPA: hypothetical protein VGP46_14455 [Acidimicrobiales bacterium]|nr:hypothetical protein [Acidimicrobiales bacterium]